MILEHKILKLYGEKVFELARVKPPFKHFNPLPDEACFLHIFEGGNYSSSQEDSVYVAERQSVLMKCGNYFYDLKPKSETGNSGIIAVHFHPDVLRRIYEKETPSFLSENLVDVNHNMAMIPAGRLIDRFVEDLEHYFLHKSLATEDLLILKLKEIILLLLQTSNAPKVHNIMYNLFTQREISFKTTIEAHILSHLSVSDLASLTNHSLASFKRNFRKVYKRSPAGYIRKRRLEMAAEMLISSDKPVTQVALDCQFSSLAHFSNSFKQMYKISPRAYRMSQIHK
ncbi:MAG: helix-turn-helix transcriptional regulator [Roseivirga sp.]|nr:helix-turn-helix transcriptional regulator [Roseivirga sp.]